MRVIDFVGSGAEPLIYVIRSSASGEIYWRGTRKDFIYEMSVFFIFFSTPVNFFDAVSEHVIDLYV